ncbi:MAG: MarR family transcriptional regulator [Pseudomonadota bacterium]
MAKKTPSVQSYISYSLAAAHRRLHSDLNEELKKIGLQVEAWRVLQSLQMSEGYTMSELAEIVLMNKPTLTKLVDRMVADGLVQRKLGQEDQRQVRLILTNLGARICKDVMQHAERQNDDIIERIGAEKAQILRDALDELSAPKPATAEQ